MTSITIYDGADTIGGNKIYLEENEKGVFLDFGMNFKKYGVFYEEFLKDRVIRGIHDLIYLDLIPKLNIYRNDLIPSDVCLSSFPTLNVEAVLLSHAHMDHFGNIGFLNKAYPIVASGISLALLKGILDTSQMKLGPDVAFFAERIEGANDKTRVVSQKKEHSKFLSRNFFCTDDFFPSLEEFLTLQSRSTKPIERGSLNNIFSLSTQFDIEAFEVDHSIYGSTAYILRGSKNIAYTGDFRLHGKRAEKSKEFINRSKEVDVLIIEGTRISRNEDDKDINVSENDVYENCLDVVKEADGLAIADFSARNLERLEIFQKIADETSRELVITSKDAYLLYALEQVDHIDRLEHILLYDKIRERNDYWESHILNTAKKELQYIDPTSINHNLEKYLICFSFFDMNNLLDIKPDKGCYVYSSSEAFEEESEYDFLRLYNWLEYFGLEPHGFNLINDNGRLKPEFIEGFHASGHASKNEIRETIQMINPDIIIPVHTENPGWFKKEFNNTFLLKNGEKLQL